MSRTIRYSRFEVLQRPDGAPHVLGEDADLTIHLARDTDSDTPVVLRVPAPAVQRNPAARHRFLEEAREMAQVTHPHIAAVIHSGDTSAGAYCAMELCDGVTLEKAIEEVGALPWQEAFRIGLQLAGVIESLEKAGLVHRGLRPSSIIVSTGEDGHAHLKITDYGRVSEEAIRDTLAATKSGFIRSPAYASPEEFLTAAPPDARALQYSLGAVLWFCLTGAPLFTGTQFEVMFQHVNTEPDWKQLPDVPGPVLGVMKLLLAKSATDRFASSTAVTAAMRSAMAGITESSRRSTALDAPTTGPTALAWLKARQTLLLEEVHPFLAQVADLMDVAVAEGKGLLDAALERVHIEIEGWPALPEAQRAALLRSPMSAWPPWTVILHPVAASAPREQRASQAASFVTFCHRMLTGQGKGADRHVPTAALSPEGNAFFEKHVGTDAARGQSCRGLLELLSEAEEVSLQAAGDESGIDPLATRVVHAHGGAASGGQKQQAWLAREREALERARRDLSEQEADRARQMAEEQAHVEKLRRSLEEQKAQLDEKRREQQRLEQELQLRAQLEFQKLQEEAKARESVLHHKRAAAEEALRQREEEFRLREQERFAQLEKLKHENDAMEERVQQEYLTLRHVERRHAHLTQSTIAPPPRPEPKPAVESKPVTAQRTPTTTHQPATAQQPAMVPTTAGGIILARLTPLETPQITQRSQQASPQLAPPSRTRRHLVAVLVGLLIAGVLALIGAVALTLFSEAGAEPAEPGHAESTNVAQETRPAAPVSQPPTSVEPLRALLNESLANPARKEPLRADALAAVASIAALPQDEGAPSADLLREAGEHWGMPEAWIAAATLSKDEDTRVHCYLQAAKLGNVPARSTVGKMLLEQGVRSRHGGLVQQALSQLSQAVAAGDPEAMFTLGDALFTGRGPTENRTQGRALIERAAKSGHEQAQSWLRNHP